MTHSMLLMATEVATRCRRPLRLVCSAMGISNSNVRRWLSRLRNGEPLINQRGPKVFTSADMNEAIQFDLRGLQHGYRRSYGTQAMYQKYRGNISIRSLDKLVKQTRRDFISVSRKNNKQVSWYGSGLVWAMDDTEVTRNAENGKITLHQIRDLASRYVFPPVESKNVPDGKIVAENLDRLFKRHGAPLFVKRDNAGNFNNPHVDAVLAKYGAMPLNSPPAYPKYNGAEERGQGELKTELKRHLAGVEGWTLNTICLLYTSVSAVCVLPTAISRLRMNCARPSRRALKKMSRNLPCGESRRSRFTCLAVWAPRMSCFGRKRAS